MGKQTAKAGPTPQQNGSAWMILKLRKQTSKLAALSTIMLLHQAISLRLQAVALLILSKASASANAASEYQGCLTPHHALTSTFTRKDPCCWQQSSVSSLICFCLHTHAVTNKWVESACELLHHMHHRVAALKGDR